MTAGFGGNSRLYVSQEHRRRDFATTVLLDVSLSTEPGFSGRGMLDGAREPFVLGEVARNSAIGCAYSRLRRDAQPVSRWELLRWDELWQRGRAWLGALAPQGYTRIGLAIRYATRDLATVAAERKLLLLVSDGKPTDYDRYEGRYGIADVR